MENKGNEKITRRELLGKMSPLGRLFHEAAGCTACGICARECNSGALTVSAGESGSFRLVFRYGTCVACGLCVKACPEKCLRVERTFEPEKIGGETVVLFEDEIVRCSECGAPVGPRSMIAKVRGKVKTLRSELCIACKSRSWNGLFKDGNIA